MRIVLSQLNSKYQEDQVFDNKLNKL